MQSFVIQKTGSIRNTRVIDIIKEFSNYHANIDVYDPWVDDSEAQEEYNISMTSELKPNNYDAIIITVAHQAFKEMGIDAIRKLGKEKHILFDVKHIFPKHDVDARL